jgi:hypothetical protein
MKSIIDATLPEKQLPTLKATVGRDPNEEVQRNMEEFSSSPRVEDPWPLPRGSTMARATAIAMARASQCTIVTDHIGLAL